MIGGHFHHQPFAQYNGHLIPAPTFRQDLLKKVILVNNSSASVVPKMCSADPSGWATRSQGDLWILFCSGYSEVYLCYN